jgi:hypothetical protein
MTRDEEVLSPTLFDRRIVERNIKRGLITRKDYEKFLKSLSDAAEKVKSPDEERAEESDSAEAAGNTEPTPTASAG